MKYILMFVLLAFLSISVHVVHGADCSATQGCTDDPDTGDPRCCSQWGYCGTTFDYCGPGCLAGPCTTNYTNTSCSVTGYCPNGDDGKPLCCSKYGSCGSTNEYCGAGCTAGPCHNSTTNSSSSDETGRCIHNATCEDPSLCCSQFFYCGVEPDHCGAGCISGPCSNATGPTAPPIGSCLPTNTCVSATDCCSSSLFCGSGISYCGRECIGGPCWNNDTAPQTVPIIMYSKSLSIGLGVIVGVCTLFGLAASFILAVKTTYFARNGPFYCAIIIFGVILSYLASFITLAKQNDALCIAFPWILGIAFDLVYGCLFIKTWVVYSIFRGAAQMKRIAIRPFYILKILTIFVAIEVIILIAWTIKDPPRATHVKFITNSLTTEYEIQCRTRDITFWAIFFVFKVGWLLFGSVLSFLTRKMSSEYNSSKSIAYAIYNNVVVMLVGVPLGAVLSDTMYGLLVVKVVAILISFTFTLFVINFFVWYKIFYERFDTISGIAPANKTETTYNSRNTFTDSSSRNFTDSLPRNSYPDSKFFTPSSPPDSPASGDMMLDSPRPISASQPPSNNLSEPASPVNEPPSLNASEPSSPTSEARLTDVPLV